MAFSGPLKGVKNDINVTPLVDVVLVLLIIFMVITPMLQRGKELNLPKAHMSDENKKPDALTISLLADHTIWLGNTLVAPSSLRAEVTESLRAAPDRKILIKGDESLTVGDVRAVVTEAEAAGAKGVSLAVSEYKK